MASSQPQHMSSAQPYSVENLVNAGKQVESVIKRDQFSPDLFNLFTGQYSESYRKPLTSDTEEFSIRKSVPTPTMVVQKLLAASGGTFMGLLPEIERAWASIDNTLYIWSFTKPDLIYEYDDQDQIITAVGLVKPNPNIFGKDINHLLVITTALQIIVLALTVEGDDIKMFGTGYTTSIDDHVMKKIIGTEDGRIFMYDRLGSVFEFKYRHPDNWHFRSASLENKSGSILSKYLPSIQFMSQPEAPKIKSIAIDDERKTLYICTATSIEVVYLGNPTKDYDSKVKNKTIIQDANQLYRNNLNPDVFTLESIHVISKAESKYVHLMAITSAGFRLYFTHFENGFRLAATGSSPQSEVPSALELGHIRLPAVQVVPTPGNPIPLVKNTYYDCGICVTSRQINQDRDSIHVTAATYDTNQAAQPTTTTYGVPMIVKLAFEETHAIVETESLVHELTELNTEKKGKHYLKEIAQQISDPPRRFIALSARQIEFYDKLRPVDVLLRILKRHIRREADEQKMFQQFFERYTSTQSCAMCLSIICNEKNPAVIELATRLFFELGGAPTAANATQAPGNHLGQVVGQTGINYSGRHNGFVLYLARLVAPIWHLKVFANRDYTNRETRVQIARVQKLLFDARHNLGNLDAFMKNNRNFHDSATIADPRFQSADKAKIELDLSEQKSVHELYQLLKQCLGAVYFIEFLLDSGIQEMLTPEHVVLEQLACVDQLDINAMLTTNDGRDLAKELVIATITKNGPSTTQNNFDVTSTRLAHRCGDYFSEKDILFFKGMENLTLAYYTDTEYERTAAIKESLDKFKQAVDTISPSKFKTVCSVYVDSAFHVGVIELALERASKVDPQNLGLQAYESPKPQDEATLALLNKRMEAYGYALAALDDTLLILYNKSPARRTPIADPTVHFRFVMDAAVRHTDALFHFAFYQWLLNNNMREHLLTISSPYLVPFFKKHVENQETSMDFLWQYYRHKEEYAQAADCLFKLAQASSTTMNLKDRSRYLSQASFNLRSAMEDPISNVKLAASRAYLEQRLLICQVQERIQNILRSQINDVEAQLAADSLNRGILDMDALQRDYVARFPRYLEHILEAA